MELRLEPQCFYEMEYPIRINKYLRDSGLASRREADKLVEDGFVLVNGKPIKNGFMVNKDDKDDKSNKDKNKPLIGEGSFYK